MTEPLTRRELRERERRAAEAEAAEAPQPRPLSRRELRAREAPPATETPAETTAERSAIRRRPVQAPTTTDSLAVVDPATGAVSEVSLTFAEPEVPVEASVEAPAPVEAPADTPAPVETPAVTPPPVETPTPTPTPAPLGGPPQRRSLRERDAVPDFDQPMSVEQAAIVARQERAGRPAFVGILRFLVLVLAALLVGALIWVVADRASAEVTIAVARDVAAGVSP